MHLIRLGVGRFFIYEEPDTWRIARFASVSSTYTDFFLQYTMSLHVQSWCKQCCQHQQLGVRLLAWAFISNSGNI